MEDTLREVFGKVFSTPVRLNPCFNGRYSQRANPTTTNKEVCES